MRQNPYGSRTMDNPTGGRIPMANTDPRHNALFAQAFAMAYVAKVLDAELECLTLSAVTGSFAIMRMPGRLRQRICDGSTARPSRGQRVNKASSAQLASIRAS